MGNNAGSLKHHLETAEKTGALAFPDKKLEEFPPSLNKVSGKLRNLDLSSNKIPSIPPSIGHFKMLKNLKLTDNRITELPDSVGDLVKLECLFIGGNSLRNLPPSMRKLKSLRELDVSGNRLQTIPQFVFELKKLDSADFSRNKIAELPAEMSGLSATELNLNQNQISRLPVTLASCPKLKALRLEENCLALDSVPAELLSSSGISLLAVAGNLFDEKKMSEIPGYDKYMERFTAARRKLD